MENFKEKKPRTIRMKYPAPYSQSCIEANPTKVVSNRKPKLNSTNQSNLALHSQSWANDGSRRFKRRNLTPKKSSQINYPLSYSKSGPNGERKVPRQRTSNVTPTRRLNEKRNPAPFTPVCCHARPQIRGPDPTAPHLKYGLFPQPKRNTNRVQMQVLNAPEHKLRICIPEHSYNRDKKVKPNKKGDKGLPAEEPTFVFRATEHNQPQHKQLTVSPPAHMDISPRDKYTRHTLKRDAPMPITPQKKCPMLNKSVA